VPAEGDEWGCVYARPRSLAASMSFATAIASPAGAEAGSVVSPWCVWRTVAKATLIGFAGAQVYPRARRGIVEGRHLVEVLGYLRDRLGERGAGAAANAVRPRGRGRRLRPTPDFAASAFVAPGWADWGTRT